MMVLYYMTFLFLIITNWFLYQYIKKNNLRTNALAEGKVYLLICVAFSISFLYRAVFDTVIRYTDSIEVLESDHVGLW